MMTKKIQEIADKISIWRETLLASINGLSGAQINFKPAEGEWSIADILHHLALADEANVRLSGLFFRQIKEQSVPADPSPDGSALDCMDKFRDGLSGKAKAPERVAPLSHLAAEESLARMRASREKLIEAMSGLSAYDLSRVSFPHPLLGALNGYQWLMIAGLHEIRHAAQIERIKTGEGFPAN
ncbi:MAG: DinB family protein [Acidobacteriota bacterium]